MTDGHNSPSGEHGGAEGARVHGRLDGVVALDGPSGTGKSTIARRLAGALGARYLDTGAMYRAATLAVSRAHVDPADIAVVAEVVAAMRLDIGVDPAVASTYLDGEDVAGEIRGPEVTDMVSAVSAVPRVRELLIARQRRIIDAVQDSGHGIVVEGRDIGTVVAPNAGLKVYLTATSETRARRRTLQDGAAGYQCTVDETKARVDHRDRLDSRVTPMRPAEDAIELDTTSLDVLAVLDKLLSLVDERGMCRPVPDDRVVPR